MADTSASSAAAVNGSPSFTRAAGASSADGDRFVAGDLDARDPVLGAAGDGEGDDQVIALGLAGEVCRRIAVALTLPERLDALGRVLEQILVGRSLARDRHQLVAAIAGQRIAAELHADPRTGLDDERQRHLVIDVIELRRHRHPRLVVARCA